MFDLYFFAMHIDLTGCNTTDTEDSFHQFCSLCTYQSTKSKDFSFMELKTYILERFCMDGAKIFYFHNHFITRFVFSRWIYIGQLTANHLCDDLVCGHLCCRPGSNICTIPHDCDIISDPFDLIHLM